MPLQHCPPELEAERDQVLAARIVRLDVADRRIVVSLADAPESAEGARPLRLYPDGPVFLCSDGMAAVRSASELDRSEGELSDMRVRLEQAVADCDAARAERDRLAEELRDERARARGLAADLRSTHDGAADLESVLRSDALRDPGAFTAWLGVAHAKLHEPAERARYPLRRVVVGPAFLDSLRELQGVSLHRVLDTCVHVVTGRAPRSRPRAASAARGGGGHRAAAARRRSPGLALRAPGARAIGAAAALLAPRRRGRARTRRHARRRYLRPSTPLGTASHRGGAS